ncbi:MAG TPA: hypothetical protein VE057_20430 [Archangium sp.]|nr:hypothetical protein [Archangium sp.]
MASFPFDCTFPVNRKLALTGAPSALFTRPWLVARATASSYGLSLRM